jgi:hypothetical protein
VDAEQLQHLQQHGKILHLSTVAEHVGLVQRQWQRGGHQDVGEISA